VFQLRPFKVKRSGLFENIGLARKTPFLFFAEGRRWSYQRRLVSPAFNVSAVQSYIPAVCDIVDILTSRLVESSSTGESLNVCELMQCFNADVISKVAFASDLHSLRNHSEVLEDVKQYFGALLKRFAAPVSYWKLPGLGNFIDGGDAAVERLRKRMAAVLADPKSTEQDTLLRKLKETEGDKLSPEELMGNLIGLFVAGTDTTSMTLSWALYQLARRPDLQSAIAEEISMFAGDPSKLADRVSSLRLIQATWKETLRLNAVAPFLALENLEPFQLAGRTVPPGTSVWTLTREAQRQSPEMRAALGDDWDAFRPERWLAKDGSGFVQCPDMDSWVFGHGARVCPGKGLANTIGPLVLASIVRDFRIGKWEGPPVGEKSNFVQAPAEDIWLRFTAKAGLGKRGGA
jgi:cytochrome P450